MTISYKTKSDDPYALFMVYEDIIREKGFWENSWEYYDAIDEWAQSVWGTEVDVDWGYLDRFPYVEFPWYTAVINEMYEYLDGIEEVGYGYTE